VAPKNSRRTAFRYPVNFIQMRYARVRREMSILECGRPRRLQNSLHAKLDLADGVLDGSLRPPGPCRPPKNGGFWGAAAPQPGGVRGGAGAPPGSSKNDVFFAAEGQRALMSIAFCSVDLQACSSRPRRRASFVGMIFGAPGAARRTPSFQATCCGGCMWSIRGCTLGGNLKFV